MNRRVARPEGFEPPTTWFEAKCSIQMSYGRSREKLPLHSGVLENKFPGMGNVCCAMSSLHVASLPLTFCGVIGILSAP